MSHSTTVVLAVQVERAFHLSYARSTWLGELSLLGLQVRPCGAGLAWVGGRERSNERCCGPFLTASRSSEEVGSFL